MRAVATLALALYGIRCLLHPEHYRLMDGVDLAIHETGHLLFAPFGEFLGMAGGTLLQLIFPAAFVVYFWRRGDAHAASVALWWVAQSLWNVSVYVRDARAQMLPLVGGGEHDWAYLLGRLDVLAFDQSIARTVHLVGVLFFAASIVWGLAVLWRTSPEVAAVAEGEHSFPKS